MDWNRTLWVESSDTWYLPEDFWKESGSEPRQLDPRNPEDAQIIANAKGRGYDPFHYRTSERYVLGRPSEATKELLRLKRAWGDEWRRNYLRSLSPAPEYDVAPMFMGELNEAKPQSTDQDNYSKTINETVFNILSSSPEEREKKIKSLSEKEKELFSQSQAFTKYKEGNIISGLTHSLYGTYETVARIIPWTNNWGVGYVRRTDDQFKSQDWQEIWDAWQRATGKDYAQITELQNFIKDISRHYSAYTGKEHGSPDDSGWFTAGAVAGDLIQAALLALAITYTLGESAPAAASRVLSAGSRIGKLFNWTSKPLPVWYGGNYGTALTAGGISAGMQLKYDLQEPWRTTPEIAGRALAAGVTGPIGAGFIGSPAIMGVPKFIAKNVATDAAAGLTGVAGTELISSISGREEYKPTGKDVFSSAVYGAGFTAGLGLFMPPSGHAWAASIDIVSSARRSKKIAHTLFDSNNKFSIEQRILAPLEKLVNSESTSDAGQYIELIQNFRQKTNNFYQRNKSEKPNTIYKKFSEELGDDLENLVNAIPRGREAIEVVSKNFISEISHVIRQNEELVKSLEQLPPELRIHNIDKEVSIAPIGIVSSSEQYVENTLVPRIEVNHIKAAEAILSDAIPLIPRISVIDSNEYKRLVSFISKSLALYDAGTEFTSGFGIPFRSGIVLVPESPLEKEISEKVLQPLLNSTERARVHIISKDENVVDDAISNIIAEYRESIKNLSSASAKDILNFVDNVISLAENSGWESIGTEQFNKAWSALDSILLLMHGTPFIDNDGSVKIFAYSQPSLKHGLSTLEEVREASQLLRSATAPTPIQSISQVYERVSLSRELLGNLNAEHLFIPGITENTPYPVARIIEYAHSIVSKASEWSADSNAGLLNSLPPGSFDSPEFNLSKLIEERGQEQIAADLENLAKSALELTGLKSKQLDDLLLSMSEGGNTDEVSAKIKTILDSIESDLKALIGRSGQSDLFPILQFAYQQAIRNRLIGQAIDQFPFLAVRFLRSAEGLQLIQSYMYSYIPIHKTYVEIEASEAQKHASQIIGSTTPLEASTSESILKNTLFFDVQQKTVREVDIDGSGPKQISYHLVEHSTRSEEVEDTVRFLSETRKNHIEAMQDASDSMIDKALLYIALAHRISGEKVGNWASAIKIITGHPNEKLANFVFRLIETTFATGSSEEKEFLTTHVAELARFINGQQILSPILYGAKFNSILSSLGNLEQKFIKSQIGNFINTLSHSLKDIPGLEVFTLSSLRRAIFYGDLSWLASESIDSEYSKHIAKSLLTLVSLFHDRIAISKNTLGVLSSATEISDDIKYLVRNLSPEQADSIIQFNSRTKNLIKLLDEAFHTSLLPDKPEVKNQFQAHYTGKDGNPLPINRVRDIARQEGILHTDTGDIERSTSLDSPLYGKSEKIIFSFVPRSKTNPERNSKYAIVERSSVVAPFNATGNVNLRHFLQEIYWSKAESAEEHIRGSADIPDNTLFDSDGTPYNGAPVVNNRGEIIQGSKRFLKISNNADEYKAQLRERAEEFGFRPEDVDKFVEPVLVRVINVSDNDAIILGSYTDKNFINERFSVVQPSEWEAFLNNTLPWGTILSLDDITKNYSREFLSFFSKRKIIEKEVYEEYLKLLRDDPDKAYIYARSIISGIFDVQIEKILSPRARSILANSPKHVRNIVETLLVWSPVYAAHENPLGHVLRLLEISNEIQNILEKYPTRTFSQIIKHKKLTSEYTTKDIYDAYTLYLPETSHLFLAGIRNEYPPLGKERPQPMKGKIILPSDRTSSVFFFDLEHESNRMQRSRLKKVAEIAIGSLVGNSGKSRITETRMLSNKEFVYSLVHKIELEQGTPSNFIAQASTLLRFYDAERAFVFWEANAPIGTLFDDGSVAVPLLRFSTKNLNTSKIEKLGQTLKENINEQEVVVIADKNAFWFLFIAGQDKWEGTTRTIGEILSKYGGNVEQHSVRLQHVSRRKSGRTRTRGLDLSLLDPESQEAIRGTLKEYEDNIEFEAPKDVGPISEDVGHSRKFLSGEMLRAILSPQKLVGETPKVNFPDTGNIIEKVVGLMRQVRDYVGEAENESDFSHTIGKTIEEITGQTWKQHISAFERFIDKISSAETQQEVADTLLELASSGLKYVSQRAQFYKKIKGGKTEILDKYLRRLDFLYFRFFSVLDTFVHDKETILNAERAFLVNKISELTNIPIVTPYTGNIDLKIRGRANRVFPFTVIGTTNTFTVNHEVLGHAILSLLVNYQPSLVYRLIRGLEDFDLLEKYRGSVDSIYSHIFAMQPTRYTYYNTNFGNEKLIVTDEVIARFVTIITGISEQFQLEKIRKEHPILWRWYVKYKPLGKEILNSIRTIIGQNKNEEAGVFLEKLAELDGEKIGLDDYLRVISDIYTNNEKFFSRDEILFLFPEIRSIEKVLSWERLITSIIYLTNAGNIIPTIATKFYARILSNMLKDILNDSELPEISGLSAYETIKAFYDDTPYAGQFFDEFRSRAIDSQKLRDPGEFAADVGNLETIEARIVKNINDKKYVDSQEDAKVIYRILTNKIPEIAQLYHKDKKSWGFLPAFILNSPVIFWDYKNKSIVRTAHISREQFGKLNLDIVGNLARGSEWEKISVLHELYLSHSTKRTPVLDSLQRLDDALYYANITIKTLLSNHSDWEKYNSKLYLRFFDENNLDRRKRIGSSDDSDIILHEIPWLLQWDKHPLIPKILYMTYSLYNQIYLPSENKIIHRSPTSTINFFVPSEEDIIKYLIYSPADIEPLVFFHILNTSSKLRELPDETESAKEFSNNLKAITFDASHLAKYGITIPEGFTVYFIPKARSISKRLEIDEFMVTNHIASLLSELASKSPWCVRYQPSAYDYVADYDNILITDPTGRKICLTTLDRKNNLIRELAGGEEGTQQILPQDFESVKYIIEQLTGYTIQDQSHLYREEHDFGNNTILRSIFDEVQKNIYLKKTEIEKLENELDEFIKTLNSVEKIDTLHEKPLRITNLVTTGQKVTEKIIPRGIPDGNTFLPLHYTEHLDIIQDSWPVIQKYLRALWRAENAYTLAFLSIPPEIRYKSKNEGSVQSPNLLHYHSIYGSSSKFTSYDKHFFGRKRPSPIFYNSELDSLVEHDDHVIRATLLIIDGAIKEITEINSQFSEVIDRYFTSLYQASLNKHSELEKNITSLVNKLSGLNIKSPFIDTFIAETIRGNNIQQRTLSNLEKLYKGWESFQKNRIDNNINNDIESINNALGNISRDINALILPAAIILSSGLYDANPHFLLSQTLSRKTRDLTRVLGTSIYPVFSWGSSSFELLDTLNFLSGWDTALNGAPMQRDRFYPNLQAEPALSTEYIYMIAHHLLLKSLIGEDPFIKVGSEKVSQWNKLGKILNTEHIREAFATKYSRILDEVVTERYGNISELLNSISKYGIKNEEGIRGETPLKRVFVPMELSIYSTPDMRPTFFANYILDYLLSSISQNKEHLSSWHPNLDIIFNFTQETQNVLPVLIEKIGNISEQTGNGVEAKELLSSLLRTNSIEGENKIQNLPEGFYIHLSPLQQSIDNLTKFFDNFQRETINPNLSNLYSFSLGSLIATGYLSNLDEDNDTSPIAQALILGAGLPASKRRFGFKNLPRINFATSVGALIAGNFLIDNFKDGNNQVLGIDADVLKSILTVSALVFAYRDYRKLNRKISIPEKIVSPEQKSPLPTTMEQLTGYAQHFYGGKPVKHDVDSYYQDLADFLSAMAPKTLGALEEYLNIKFHNKTSIARILSASEEIPIGGIGPAMVISNNNPWLVALRNRLYYIDNAAKDIEGYTVGHRILRAHFPSGSKEFIKNKILPFLPFSKEFNYNKIFENAFLEKRNAPSPMLPIEIAARFFMSIDPSNYKERTLNWLYTGRTLRNKELYEISKFAVNLDREVSSLIRKGVDEETINDIVTKREDEFLSRLKDLYPDIGATYYAFRAYHDTTTTLMINSIIQHFVVEHGIPYTKDISIGLEKFNEKILKIQSNIESAQERIRYASPTEQQFLVATIGILERQLEQLNATKVFIEQISNIPIQSARRRYLQHWHQSTGKYTVKWEQHENGELIQYVRAFKTKKEQLKFYNELTELSKKTGTIKKTIRIKELSDSNDIDILLSGADNESIGVAEVKLKNPKDVTQLQATRRRLVISENVVEIVNSLQSIASHLSDTEYLSSYTDQALGQLKKLVEEIEFDEAHRTRFEELYNLSASRKHSDPEVIGKLLSTVTEALDLPSITYAYQGRLMRIANNLKARKNVQGYTDNLETEKDWISFAIQSADSQIIKSIKLLQRSLRTMEYVNLLNTLQNIGLSDSKLAAAARTAIGKLQMQSLSPIIPDSFVESSGLLRTISSSVLLALNIFSSLKNFVDARLTARVHLIRDMWDLPILKNSLKYVLVAPRMDKDGLPIDPILREIDRYFTSTGLYRVGFASQFLDELEKNSKVNWLEKIGYLLQGISEVEANRYAALHAASVWLSKKPGDTEGAIQYATNSIRRSQGYIMPETYSGVEHLINRTPLTLLTVLMTTGFRLLGNTMATFYDTVKSQALRSKITGSNKILNAIVGSMAVGLLFSLFKGVKGTPIVGDIYNIMLGVYDWATGENEQFNVVEEDPEMRIRRKLREFFEYINISPKTADVVFDIFTYGIAQALSGEGYSTSSTITQQLKSIQETRFKSLSNLVKSTKENRDTGQIIFELSRFISPILGRIAGGTYQLVEGEYYIGGKPTGTPFGPDELIQFLVYGYPWEIIKSGQMERKGIPPLVGIRDRISFVEKIAKLPGINSPIAPPPNSNLYSAIARKEIDQWAISIILNREFAENFRYRLIRNYGRIAGNQSGELKRLAVERFMKMYEEVIKRERLPGVTADKKLESIRANIEKYIDENMVAAAILYTLYNDREFWINNRKYLPIPEMAPAYNTIYKSPDGTRTRDWEKVYRELPISDLIARLRSSQTTKRYLENTVEYHPEEIEPSFIDLEENQD